MNVHIIIYIYKFYACIYKFSSDPTYLTIEALHTSIFTMAAVMDSHSTMSTLRQTEFTAIAMDIVQQCLPSASSKLLQC